MLGSNFGLIDSLLVSFLTVLFISIVIKFSSKIGMLDIPNDRSSHVNPTPRGAGVAMFFAYMLVLLVFHLDFVYENIGFFTALFMIFSVGVYDDNQGVSPKIKFIAIILASLLIFFTNDIHIDTLGTWFGYEVKIHWIISLIITIFAIVGFTNALNLLDGLDGLAAGISSIIFLSFLYVGYTYGDSFIMIVSLVMLFSLIGFLFFNWNPASIFMGDSGSLVLGFAISVVAIKATEYISVMSILLIASMPIVDTLVVMTRRLQRGLSPFNPDKTHIHHKMLTWRGSVDYSVMILIVIQLVFSSIGLLLREYGDESSFVLVALMMYLFFNFLDERKLVRDKLSLTKLKRSASLYIKNDLTYRGSIIIVCAIICLLIILRVAL